MPENSALDLKAMQEQNRAALMDAITRRNDLHVEVERLEQRTATLEREATEALRDGNRGTAKLRLQAKVAADQELQTRRGELAGIETSVEEVKRSIRDLEDLLRMQPPEATRPSTISASAGVEEMAPLPNVLSDTLDTLASGDHGQPLEVEIATSDSEAEADEKDIQLYDEARPLVPAPSASIFDFSPEAEAVVATRASERNLTSEEYTSAVRQSLAALTELIMPVSLPQPSASNAAYTNSVEQILEDAVRELKANQVENREYTVRVLTQKYQLNAEAGKQTRIIADYERKALAALNEGNLDLARQLHGAKQAHEQILGRMQSLLIQATDVAEKAKQLIRQQEERIRVRVTKTLLVRANLTAAVIAFQLDLLQEENQTQKNADDFDVWVHAQRPGSPE